jgi:hypothetical protein
MCTSIMKFTQLNRLYIQHESNNSLLKYNLFARTYIKGYLCLEKVCVITLYLLRCMLIKMFILLQYFALKPML